MHNSKIETLIYSMLTESTGQSLCDSGEAYGRHWEKNQKRTIEDFRNDKEVEIELDRENNEYSYTISLFHYLQKLEINDVCDVYNALPCNDWESDIYGVSKLQKEWIEQQGFEIGDSFNSYNGESNLSQVIQGTYVKLGIENYVLLQIHQGCDVRGGYTDAKLFYLSEDYMPSENVSGIVIFEDGAEMFCSNYYDGTRLRYDCDDSDNTLHEKEIEPKGIKSIELSIS